MIDGGMIDSQRLAAKGIPIGRVPAITLRNAHLQYIVTWYILFGGFDLGIRWLLLRQECATLYLGSRGQRMRNEC
jgi:cytochrome oxidase assembly protein ShyY1